MRAVIYSRNQDKIFAAMKQIRDQTGREMSATEIINMFLDDIEAYTISQISSITLKHDPDRPGKPRKTTIKKATNFATNF